VLLLFFLSLLFGLQSPCKQPSPCCSVTKFKCVPADTMETWSHKASIINVRRNQSETYCSGAHLLSFKNYSGKDTRQGSSSRSRSWLHKRLIWERKTGLNWRCWARAWTLEGGTAYWKHEFDGADKQCFKSWMCTLTCQDHNLCFWGLPGIVLQLVFGHRGWFSQAEAGTPTASCWFLHLAGWTWSGGRKEWAVWVVHGAGWGKSCPELLPTLACS